MARGRSSHMQIGCKSGGWSIILRVMLALAAVLALAPPTRAAEHVKLCSVRSMGGSPGFVANEKGFFAAQGLDAELMLFDSAQPISVAVASGDCDFGVTGLTAAFFNFASQGTLKVIGAGTWEHPGFDSVGILVSNQAYAAGLHSFKDLGGHSVAITQLGSPLQYFTLQIAQKYRIDPAGIRFLALQSNGNVASAIAGGQADTAVQTAAPIFAVIARGDGRLLGWTSDELPPRQGEAVFTATTTADQKPETVRRFLRGLQAGQRYMHDAFLDTQGQRHDSPEAQEIIRFCAKYLDQPEALIARGIPYYDPQGRIALDDIRALAAWYKSQHMIKAEIDPRSIVDMRYAVEMPEVLSGTPTKGR